MLVIDGLWIHWFRTSRPMKPVGFERIIFIVVGFRGEWCFCWKDVTRDMVWKSRER